MIRKRIRVLGIVVACCAVPVWAAPETVTDPLHREIDRRAAEVENQVIEWRRDIHRFPELGNREVRTAGLVAEHLRHLGVDEVRTGIAHTGVVGVLKGGRPGGVVALRADMDALPVTEKVDLPFASKVRSEYRGQEVGVMHACGHDAHTAVLMGAASVLAGMRAELSGTVVFIFQPAEEGPPPGEEGGARLMIEEGALDDPVPGAIFGLHTMTAPAGLLGYRPGGILAGADGLHIVVHGRQTHGALPWKGVDPIVVASQIVLGLQTIPSRQLNVTSPTIVSIGSIHGGARGNIIPEQVEMTGTIRILNPATRADVHERIERTATGIAASAGATASVKITPYAPVTYNDPELTSRMASTLQRVAGPQRAVEVPPLTASEDFSHYQQHIPGFYFFLGINAPGVAEAAPNHSPHFFVNEDALVVGVRAMASLAYDYLAESDFE